jgi:hypothetical protein
MAVDKGGKDTRTMPLGDEKRDQIKANEDALAERAETEAPNVVAANPEAFKIENEVAQHLGANSRDPREVGRARVRNMQPGMEYLWVYEAADQIAEAENRFADAMSIADCDYQGVQWHGYELVQGDMPEANDRRDERGYRRIGDTLLFRAPKVLVDRWQRARDIWSMARQQGIGEGLMAQADMIARRNNVPASYVIALAGNLEPGELRRLGRQNLREIAQKDAIIRDLRAGTVPRMEIK